MVIRRIAGVVRIMGGHPAHKSHYPTNWKDLPDYVQAMKLVRPYGASPSRLCMMWTVGQLQRHCGSIGRDSAATILAPLVLTTTPQVGGLYSQCGERAVNKLVNLLTGRQELWILDDTQST